MLSSRQRSPKIVLIMGSDAFRNETGLSRTRASVLPDASRNSVVPEISGVPDTESPKHVDATSLNVARAPAQWASLDWDDRQVFNNWARWVAIFYLSLAVALLGVILLGVYLPADQKIVPVSPAMERSSPESAQATRSIR